MCPKVPLAPVAGKAPACGGSDLRAPEPDSFEALYDMTGSELGSGSSGPIRVAFCRRSGRTVAVKTYQTDRMREKQLAYMKSELAVHRRLSHPGIVNLEGIYESEGVVRVVMEHMHGGELFDRILKEGCLSEQETAEVAVQLLQALVYLHDRHIVHRDIKLENLMYERHGENKIKVIDFGFSATRDSRKKMVQLCGSRGYIAPEMLERKPYDEKVDLWSTGVVVYGMLTGRQLVDDGEVRLCDAFFALPDSAQSFVAALLHADPQKRSGAREALEHPWLEQFVPAQQRTALSKPITAQPALCWAFSETLSKLLAASVLAICS